MTEIVEGIPEPEEDDVGGDDPSSWTLVAGDIDTRPPASRIVAKVDGSFLHQETLPAPREVKPVVDSEVEVGVPPNRASLKAEGLFGKMAPFGDEEGGKDL